MDALSPFLLPIGGLKNGFHQFDFQVDKSFFDRFESSLIQDGDFDLIVFMDKRTDMLDLKFVFKGFAKTDCDRCLAPIRLPTEGENRLIVKFGEEQPEEKAEVFYLPIGETEFSVAPFVYEFISLALPMIKRYDCEKENPRPCDLGLLAKLSAVSSSDGPTQVGDSDDSPWDVLKNLNS